MAKAVVWDNVSMLTLGMKNLGNQFNAAFPNRDGASDGAIGDYAHSQEDSGHNPDDTSRNNAEWDGDSDNKSEVRAIDVDDDLNDPEVTMQDVIDHMRKLPDLYKVIRYMIYNKKIYKASNNFAAETYTGVSAHTEHAHFSGAYSDASDDNKTFDYKFEELVQMATLPILKGANNQDVAYYQYILTKLGYSVGTVDGDFGDATLAAVNKHRAAHGQGASNGITAWHAFVMLCDLADLYAGKDGAPGKDGAAGKDGKDATLTGTLKVTGGELTVEAQN